MKFHQHDDGRCLEVKAATFKIPVSDANTTNLSIHGTEMQPMCYHTRMWLGNAAVIYILADTCGDSNIVPFIEVRYI